MDQNELNYSNFHFDFDMADYADLNFTDLNFTDSLLDPDFVIGTNHIVALVCYSLVFIVGVPGNALVAFVTAFRMPRSVNALWFLNLALADLLCCLSLPLLMVPLAQDQHWSMGPLACKLLHGMLYLVMYCSVLLLVLISVDRWMLVSWPVWCQNWRRPRYAFWVCLGVWVLALLGTGPQFAVLQAYNETPLKTECKPRLASMGSAWALIMFRFLMGFVLPFLVICVSHLRVYQRASSGQGRKRSSRAAHVIMAVVLSFFLCWAPLHALDIAQMGLLPNRPDHRFTLAHVLAMCLAYVNSCLNPIIYVCMGRGFKEGLMRSLRSVLHIASEAPTQSFGVTHNSKSTSKSTSDNTTDRCV